MSKRTIVIPAPVARPDQAVEVHNYRIKNRVVFERGKCIEAEYRVYEFSESWGYTVILDRRNPSGDCIRLYVGDSGIRPVSGEAAEVQA